MGTGEYGHIQVRVRGAQQPDVPCESGIRKPVTDENSHLCKKEEHGYQIDQEMTLREIMIMMKIKVKDLQCSFSWQARTDGKIIVFHQNTYEEVKITNEFFLKR